MSHPPVPRYNITDALTHLGADPQSIPTGPGWRRMSCPFHDDRTPSARINHDLQAFMCFSCERKGDAVKMIREELGLDFKNAVAICENFDAKAGAPVPRTGWSSLDVSTF